MADVKWIKITTDIFDDEKMLLIESMPAADSIITIWFKLLTLAGKQNNSGVFLMNDRIAYTDEMLATIFRRDVNTVRLALNTFEQFGMIEVIDGVITIPKWDKHQSLDALEKKREYQKEWVKSKREKQKQLICRDKNIDSRIDSRVDVESLDKNKNREDIDKEKDTTTTLMKKKHKYGEYGHVLLSNDEAIKLQEEYGIVKTDEAIKYLDEYIEMKGAKYKSHYMALRKWVFDAISEKKQKNVSQSKSGNIFLAMAEEEGLL